MKTIGLIGGMSWESSVTYYRVINEYVARRLGGLHSAQCLLWSFDFDEIHRFQQEGRWGEATKRMSNAAAHSWRGVFRMSQQTAQSRSCSDKPSGSSAPGGEHGAFLGLSEDSSPGSKVLGELVSPPTAEKSVKPADAKDAWRCTMALHRPAAESGKVIWEMSGSSTVVDWPGRRDDIAGISRPRGEDATSFPTGAPGGCRAGLGVQGEENMSVRAHSPIVGHLVGIVILALAYTSQASGTCTTRVSVASDGTQGNSGSQISSISADGRYVAFCSVASNFVPGDTNFTDDVFVHDRVTGTTTRVSVAADGTQGDGSSTYGSISADGRYVAFNSTASNLVTGDTNYNYDIFVRDRDTGATTRVSVASDGTQADGSSTYPSISADGRYVAFTSSATNLVPGDTNEKVDIFVHDRVTGATTRVSVAADGTQGNNHSGSYTFWGNAISADGRYVGFQSSASNLVPGDTNNKDDVFVHDRDSATTTRVSVASSGTQGNANSLYPSVSGDGRYVAFASSATNLVTGDTNSRDDVFVRDRDSGTTTRVSVASDGTQGNGHSGSSLALSISADGRCVAFSSYASNLVPGDTNNTPDVFVHDRESGATTRVSVASDETQGNSSSAYPSLSADGRYVAFGSSATNLVPGDTNGAQDVFVHDRGAGCPALGDWNGDGQVDFEDFAAFPACASGPWGSPDWVLPSQLCRDVFDFDADTDVDLVDFAVFQQAVGQ